MTLAAAVLRFNGKVETVLGTRLRDALTSYAWASTVTVRAGVDPQSAPSWKLDAQDLPRVDVWCDESAVTESTINADSVQVWTVAATVSANNLADSICAQRAQFLATTAAEILAQYGPDPTNAAEPECCYMVRVVRAPAGPVQYVEGAANAQLGAWRAFVAIEVGFSWLASREWTNSPAVPMTKPQSPPSGVAVVDGANATSGRTTSMVATAAPVVVDIGALDGATWADGSTVQLGVTFAGGTTTETQTTTSEVATFATTPVAGARWTFACIDAGTGRVAAFAVLWT